MSRLAKIVQALKHYGMTKNSTCMDYYICEELKTDERKLLEFRRICLHMEAVDCNTCCLSAQEYTNEILQKLEESVKYE